jgi:hypothetical protein
MDPMMLHGIMPNVAATPRMMLTEFVYAKAASDPPTS